MSLPSTIPVRRESDADAHGFMGGDAGGILFAMLVALCAAWLVWNLRKRNRPIPGQSERPRRFGLPNIGGFFNAASNDGLKVVSSVRLTPKHSLHEVRWNGRSYLLACADHNVSVVAHSEAPTEDASA